MTNTGVIHFRAAGHRSFFGVFHLFIYLSCFSYNKHSATVFIVHGHSFLAYCKKDGGEKPPVILRKITYAHGVMGPLSFKTFLLILFFCGNELGFIYGMSGGG